MRLTYRNGRFVFLCHYVARQTAKDAGFRWDPQRREWWTDNYYNAAQLQKYADVAAQEALKHCREKIEASQSVSAELEIPAPEGLEYYPFQKAGIRYMLEHKHVLLADEMGLGKTPMSIGVINILQPKRVLVIVPNILKLNWKRELERWLIKPYNIYLVNDNAPFEFCERTIIIVNYERVIKSEVLEQLQRPVDILIIDECHKIKNPEAQRTRKILTDENALFNFADKVLLLTGSPMPNRPIELYPLINKLFPNRWSYWGFAKRYCGLYQDYYGCWKADGASNLEELHLWLREKFMLRRLKKDVLKELPEKQYQLIVFDSKPVEALLEQEKKILNKVGICKIEQVENVQQWKKALSKLLRSSDEDSSIMHVRHLLGLQKVPFVVEHLNEFFEGCTNKVVLFAHHRDVLEEIHAAFQDNSVLVYGGMTNNARQAAVDRFQNDSNCRLLCANIHVAGIGLTLTAASVVMFAELDFVPANMLQAEDRCHRIGQGNKVLIQYLVFDNSLDVHIAWLLTHKRKWAEMLLDIVPEPQEIKPEFVLC